MRRRVDGSYDWNALLEKGKERRQPLLILLAYKAAADGYSFLALAQILGVSRSYLYELYAGRRDIVGLGDRVIEANAAKLELCHFDD